MKAYARQGHRPYPKADRARNQIERVGYAPGCPGCGHPIRVHAFEGQQRVCTRGHGRVACRECAHNQASLTKPSPLYEIVTGLQSMRMSQFPRTRGTLLLPPRW